MLVVETVTNTKLAETGDIQVGDRLLTYNGQRLVFLADLLAREENTFGMQPILLRLARGDRERAISIPTGKLGLAVRPELPEVVQVPYDQGRAAFETKQYAEAAERWRDAEMPLSSGLLLSQLARLVQSGPEEDNGLLQAWEILSKVRLTADMVVLSACRTALGQEVRGEGLMGLTRAFMYAGARSVLTSLWEINDKSTSAFMQSFYSALVAGQDKAEALQSAIREMRKKEEWADPYFWSAFLLAGDAD